MLATQDDEYENVIGGVSSLRPPYRSSVLVAIHTHSVPCRANGSRFANSHRATAPDAATLRSIHRKPHPNRPTLADGKSASKDTMDCRCGSGARAKRPQSSTK